MPLSSSRNQSDFRTTRWSLIRAAQADSPAARDALAALCGAYWYPLYAYVRRRGYDAPEAQDLTQEFFVRFLEREDVQTVSEERGRFRAFLLAAMKHFLANEWDRQQAQKRGGGQALLSLDFAAAEDRYRFDPADDLTPERLFEQRWALSLLDEVMTRLRREFAASGREAEFDVLKQFLIGTQPAETYGQIAAERGTTEGAVKVAVHRLRRSYRDLLREEIARTVDGPEDVEDEIRALFAALRP